MSYESIGYAVAFKYHPPFHILENDWRIILGYNTCEIQCFGVNDVKPGTGHGCVISQFART